MKLGGLVILLGFINPQVRSFVAALGQLAVMVVVVGLEVGLVFLIFKIVQRKCGPSGQPHRFRGVLYRKLALSLAEDSQRTGHIFLAWTSVEPIEPRQTT